jgi:hypothetical protein
MAKEKRIALMTGANKGIGFEVARQLARRRHSTASLSSSPPRYRTSRSTLSVPAGSAPTWAGPTQLTHSPKSASGIVWLAADAPQDQTSKFLRDRKVIPW